MTATVSHRNTCRLCGAKDVRLVLKLQPIPLSEKYATDRATAKAEQRFPVDVYMCDDCGHVQHLDVINASDLWDSYTYFSGEAKGMPEHFAQIAAKIRRTYDPPAVSLVVDIGSNDGSLLKPFKAAGHRVLGIDPATSVARRAIEAGIPTIARSRTRVCLSSSSFRYLPRMKMKCCAILSCRIRGSESQHKKFLYLMGSLNSL